MRNTSYRLLHTDLFPKMLNRLSSTERQNLLRPLWALLKKHLVERIRCYPRTMCELFSAVAIYLVLILLETVLIEEYSKATTFVRYFSIIYR